MKNKGGVTITVKAVNDAPHPTPMPTGTLNKKGETMTIIGHDVVCPLCGVAYQVEDALARERLEKKIREREDEYVKEMYEDAKAMVMGRGKGEV